MGVFRLSGLSSSEIEAVPSRPFTTEPQYLLMRVEEAKKRGLTEIYSRIFRGSMPRLYADPSVDWETFYRSYVDTYLKRDIRDLIQVADETAFLNFMTATAARTARPLIYEEMAKDCGVSAPTVKKWLSLLISSEVVVLVQPFSNNLLKRMTKMPLLHFLDTGLCAYLLKWGNPEALERSAMAGAFFETYVFSEIYKSYLNAGREPPLFYYRDKEKREIDLLIYENGVLSPVDIKKSASPGKRALKDFKALAPLDGAGRNISMGTGAVISMAEDLLPLDPQNWSVPAWMI